MTSAQKPTGLHRSPRPSKPELYLCHTAYQVLLAVVRSLRSGGAGHGNVLVLSRSVPNPDALAARISESGAFARVYPVDETACPGLAKPGPLRHWRNARQFERLCGWRIDRRAFSAVRIANDWSVLGRYLQDRRVPYILCEDTVGGTLDADQHLLDAQRAEPGFAARQRRGTDWLYWGDARCVRAVESEDPAQCRLFPAQKLTAFSARALLAGLSADEQSTVRQIFLTAPLPQLSADTAGVADAVLLLPRSFVADGLMIQPEQNALFAAVARRYAPAGTRLFIKTHPRDTTDYAMLFPDAVILDRTMPSEVLNFCLPYRFRLAVTVQSWVLRGFTAAQQNVFLSLEEAKALL